MFNLLNGRGRSSHQGALPWHGFSEAVSTYSAVQICGATSDIEGHIRLNEKDDKKFLMKYTLDVRERPKVMRELNLMGISAIQLMPSVEAVCKKALEDLIGLHPVEMPNLPAALPTGKVVLAE